jgi:TatA/E family protein of Tat protein translocase
MTTVLQKLHVAHSLVARCSSTRCTCHNLSATSHRQPPTSTRLLQGTTLLPTTRTTTKYNPSHSSRNRNTQLVVRASFLGVGAPEAILVGVVALIVFGPKGLAQAAKSLGATLRAFQPTIRELTQVSNELKSTLEQEIGINEIRQEFAKPPPVPTPLPKRDGVDTDNDDLQGGGLSNVADSLTSSIKGAKDASAASLDPDIASKREEAAKMAWGGAAAMTGKAAGGIDGMSIEELEAELQRRKASANVPKELSSED